MSRSTSKPHYNSLIYKNIEISYVLPLSLRPFLYSLSLSLSSTSLPSSRTKPKSDHQAKPISITVVSAFWIYVWRHCVGCGSGFWVSWVGVLGWWLVEFGQWLIGWLGWGFRPLNFFSFFFLICRGVYADGNMVVARVVVAIVYWLCTCIMNWGVNILLNVL